MKIIEINSKEELDTFFETLREEAKKDAEKGKEEAENRYDAFIDTFIELAKTVVGEGAFLADADAFRRHLHKSSFERKRSFFRSFSKSLEDCIDDLLKLTAEFVSFHLCDDEPKEKEPSNKKKKG